jgi:SAM-dependent methyltransferase
MKLSRKFQKLGDSSVIVSTLEHARRWTHPVNTRRIFESLNKLDFGRIRERAPYRPNPRRIRKFIRSIQDLWLDRSPPLSILDLGCGAGYFLYICKLLGHDGIGLDIDEEPLYRETLPLLNVRRVVSRIEPQVPLPDVGQRFDLVTATRVCFHIKGWRQNLRRQEWTAEDWRFFINDIRTRFLKPDGRLFLQFNPRPDDSPFFTPELRECFLEEGALIFRSKALFAANPNHRPRFKQTDSQDSQGASV